MMISKTLKKILVLCTITSIAYATPSTPNTQEKHFKIQKAQRLEAELRKNIAPNDLTLLYSIEEQLSTLLKTCNVEHAVQAHRATLKNWIDSQDKTNDNIKDLAADYKAVKYFENILLVMQNQEIAGIVVPLAQADSNGRNELRASCSHLPDDLTDDTFLEKITTLINIFQQQDPSQSEAFLLQEQTATQEAIQRFITQINHHTPLFDKQTLPAATALQSIYQAQTENNIDNMLIAVINPLKQNIQKLDTDLSAALKRFTTTIETLTQDEQQKIDAYQKNLMRLKRYAESLKHFSDIGSTVIKNDNATIENRAQILHYVSSAYNLFCDVLKLYTDDCSNQRFGPSSQTLFKCFDPIWQRRLLVPTLIDLTLFSTKNAIMYKQEFASLSKESIKPLLMQEQKEQLKHLLQTFGSTTPLFEGKFKLNAKQTLQVNAGINTLQKAALSGLSDFMLTTNTLSPFENLVKGTSFAEQQTKRLILVALYHHTLRKQCFQPTDGSSLGDSWCPHNYAAWNTEVLRSINWASSNIAQRIENMLYNIIPSTELAIAEQDTLGILTPDIIRPLMDIATKGILGTTQVTAAMANIARFDRQQLYGQQLCNLFPNADNTELLKNYTSRELIAYATGCLTRYVGSRAIKHCAPSIFSGIKKISEWAFGEEETNTYLQMIDVVKTVLAESIAIILTHDSDEKKEEIKGMLEALNDMDSGLAGMANMFFESVVFQGREKSMAMFKLQEDAHDPVGVNRKLLYQILIKFFVNNPLRINLLTINDVTQILATFDKNPHDTTFVAQEIINLLQNNSIGKLGGSLCGFIGEGTARYAWHKYHTNPVVQP